MVSNIQWTVINTIKPGKTGAAGMACGDRGFSTNIDDFIKLYPTFLGRSTAAGWLRNDGAAAPRSSSDPAAFSVDKPVYEDRANSTGSCRSRIGKSGLTLNNPSEGAVLFNDAETPAARADEATNTPRPLGLDRAQQNPDLCAFKTINTGITNTGFYSGRPVPHHLAARLAHHHQHQQQRTA